MTKNIEEELWDILVVLVLQCYNNYFVPWGNKRRILQQNQANEKIADTRGYGGVTDAPSSPTQCSDDAGALPPSVPSLPIQESSEDAGAVPSFALNLREDLEHFLHSRDHRAHGGGEAIEPGSPAHDPEYLRFDFDKYFPWMDSEAPVDSQRSVAPSDDYSAARPPPVPQWPRTRTGVHMDPQPTVRPPPPVQVDYASRQVKISLQTLEALISLIPWHNLPRTQERPATTAASQPPAAPAAPSHTAALAPSPAGAILPGPPPPEVSTSLAVLSAVSLAKAGRAVMKLNPGTLPYLGILGNKKRKSGGEPATGAGEGRGGCELGEGAARIKYRLLTLKSDSTDGTAPGTAVAPLASSEAKPVKKGASSYFPATKTVLNKTESGGGFNNQFSTERFGKIGLLGLNHAVLGGNVSGFLTRLSLHPQSDDVTVAAALAPPAPQHTAVVVSK